MNIFCFTGNLGKDCRRGEAGGTSVLNFAVAVRSGWGDKEQTNWVDVALWGKQAESKLSDYLTKGAQVAVCGELSTRVHEGATYLTVRATSVDLVGGRSDAQQAPQQAPPQRAPQQAPQQAAPDYNLDDDIVF